jgi:hypothetical protein
LLIADRRRLVPRDGAKNMSGESKAVSGVTSEHGADLSQICDTHGAGLPRLILGRQPGSRLKMHSPAN